MCALQEDTQVVLHVNNAHLIALFVTVMANALNVPLAHIWTPTTRLVVQVARLATMQMRSQTRACSASQTANPVLPTTSHALPATPLPSYLTIPVLDNAPS